MSASIRKGLGSATSDRLVEKRNTVQLRSQSSIERLGEKKLGLKNGFEIFKRIMLETFLIPLQ